MQGLGILARAVQLIPTVLIAPLLCAAGNEYSISIVDQSDSDRQRNLEAYIENVGELIEKQTEGVFGAAQQEEMEKLQIEHDVWKIERNQHCAEKPESKVNRTHELECMAELFEFHFEHRERQISEIKNHFDRRLPVFSSKEPYLLKPPNDMSELPGSYYRGSGRENNLYLDLTEDQTYSAYREDRQGAYGRSSGNWFLDQGRVFFRPSEESEETKIDFTELFVGYQDERLFLFPGPDSESFRKIGFSRASVFSRRGLRNSE